MNRRICVCMAAILLLSGCGGPSGGPPVETAETGELSWGRRGAELCAHPAAGQSGADS